MDLLRFTTAGSVDDGKSTLIGRLLYDSKNTFEDQIEAVEATSNGGGNLDVPGEDLEKFQDNLRRNLRALTELARDGQERFYSSLASLERLRIIEQSLAASGGQMFVAQFTRDF